MAQRQPKADQQSWDQIRTDRSSFDNLLSKKHGRMDSAKLRWPAIQLRIRASKTNCACIELESRCNGKQPQPLSE